MSVRERVSENDSDRKDRRRETEIQIDETGEYELKNPLCYTKVLCVTF